jgi:ornithine cyclodeaminase/alanine dehydrogenase-like protein (mu-crystallin family)
MPIFLREADVDNLLSVREAIRLVMEALADYALGEAQNQPRQRIRAPHGVLHVMPGGWSARGYVGFKAYTSFAGSTRFYFHLFDANSGEYLAVMEANRLGQIRTGAASGVATQFLARKDARTVGIVGTGWQAESQLEAVCSVRKFEQVICFSRDAERRERFAKEMAARLGIKMVPVDSPRAAVEASDVVIAITTAVQPVIQGEWLRRGAHVNAAGGNWTHRREVDGETVRRASAIFADSVEQAKLEAGDLSAAVSENLIGWHQVQELSALVGGRARGRVDDSEITLFKSCGIALEDVAVGSYVYARAREAGIGEPLPFV